MDYGLTTQRNAALRRIPIKVSGIYKITNELNGKFYIGSAVDIRKRLRHHLFQLRKGVHISTHLQNAWNKDGESAFRFEVVEFVERESLYIREQLWLDSTRCYDDVIGYNICKIAGPPPIVNATPEMRAAISARFKGKPKSQEHRKRIGEAHRGQKHTQEHIEKQRISAKLYWDNPENRKAHSDRKKGCIAHNKGKSHSEETKRKLSEKRKKFYQDNSYLLVKLLENGKKGAEANKRPEVRLKHSLARKGKPNIKNRKYSDEQVTLWRQMRERGMSYQKISNEVGVDVATIHQRINS